MSDTLKPLSPAWWLAKLEPKLRARQAHMRLMDSYYEGDHPLPFLTKAHNAKMRDEFRQLLEDCRSNFMGLVVEASAERMRVEGFRLSAETDAIADQESWRIWQANQLDAESQAAMIEALVKGVSYLSVWAGKDWPTIMVEDPLQTIVAYEPGSGYRRRAAALKMWTDDLTDELRANVYLPDAIHKFRGRAAASDVTQGTMDGSGEPVVRWIEMSEQMERNPLNIVPIIPLRNRGRLLAEGRSELYDVTATQDRINGELFMRALAGYFSAHKQRWVVGLTLMEDPVTGKPVEPFDIAVDRLLTAEDDRVKFGEFSQTDLSGYIKAIEQDVLHIAITTRTPRHYLIEQGQSPSGDAIKSAESGLVAKVEAKMRAFGEAFEETLRLARRFAGSGDSPVDSEIVWADPETHSEAEITDAVVKLFQAGLIPWEAALEKLGFTQTQISRFAGMRAQDQLLQAVLGTQPVTEPEEEPAAA